MGRKNVDWGLYGRNKCVFMYVEVGSRRPRSRRRQVAGCVGRDRDEHEKQ